MATNYTTKTAALKATLADIRKVEATKLMVSPDGKSSTDKVDVVELIGDAQTAAEATASEALAETKTELEGKIQKAQEDAVAAAGIQVTRDLTGDYDNTDADEVLSVKTKKMNFFGSYVNVVQSATNPDEISIYIGENKNPAEFSTVTGPSGSGMYVYTAANAEYSLGAATAGSKYANCQSGGAETVYAGAEGTVITIPNTTSTVKVEAVDNSGATIKSCETAVIDGSTTPVTKEENGIKVEVYDIHKNTSDDAKDGMTPGFIRCKVKATLTNATIMPAGGFYKVKMTVAGKSNTNGTGMFIYNAGSSTPSIGDVTATYSSTGTKTVSGITYDSGAKVSLSVTGIKDTQSMATSNVNRISVSDNSNGRLGDIGAVKVADLTAANGTSKTAANAEFSYTKDITFTADHTPAVMSGTYTVTPYKYDNNTYATGKKEASFSGTNYLWNGTETNDSDAKANFHTDGSRLAYTVLTDASGNVTGLDLTTTATFDSAKSLATDYPQQLLIQGEKLKHPGGASMDVTGTYSSTNCTGTRYWTKLIKVGTSGDAKTTYTITGSNLNGTGVKIWAVCANTDATATAGAKSLLINALGSAGGFAKSVSSSSLSVEIPGGQMTCKQNSCFYLVVQLPAGSTVQLGAITVA